MAGMSRRVSGLLFGVVLLLGVVRVAATHSVFSATIDENEHIEAGLEFWQLGRYQYEPQHPPLARAILAAGPYFLADLRLGQDRLLHGQRRTKAVDAPRERFESFLWAGEWRDPRLRRETLQLARAGNLLFWVLLLAGVYLWALEALGSRVAWIAAAVAACSPTLLAHAGLATLDLPAAATATAAAYAFWRWLRSRTRRDLAIAAGAFALAVGAKLSLPAFLLPAFAILLWPALRERRARLTEGALFVGIAAAVVWAIYGFDFGTVGPGGRPYVSPELTPDAPLARGLGASLGGLAVPAPALVRGVIDVVAHNAGNHRSYLFGEWSASGSPLYFPVALAVKATLPFLALALWGAWLLWRDDRRLALALLALPLGVLAVAVPAQLNIGVRHVLPLFPCLAVLAAAPFRNWTPTKLHWLAAALLIWHVGESARAHPDYLPYFNPVTSLSEAPVLLDSNLDWGQDLARLSEWIEANGAEAVIVRAFGDVPPELPDRLLPVGHPDAGWFAVSKNYLYGMEGLSPELQLLATKAPEAVVGESIFIYRVDPRSLPQLVPPWVLERYQTAEVAP